MRANSQKTLEYSTALVGQDVYDWHVTINSHDGSIFPNESMQIISRQGQVELAGWKFAQSDKVI